jgi:rubrerythrin
MESSSPLLRELIAILQRAHAGELGASLAYRGHARSLQDPDEKRKVLEIAREEEQHRRNVGLMLEHLGAVPAPTRELVFRGIGTLLSAICRISGWLAPMYGAGRLESGNIREYEEAAGLAIAAGHSYLAPELLRMAEVEWEHERYFREKVLSVHFPSWALWPAPLPKASIGPRLPREPSARAQGERSESRSEKRWGWGPSALKRRSRSPAPIRVK